MMPGVNGWINALHRRCNTTCVPTQDLAEQLEARGIPNVRTIGRGVDTQLFNPTRRDADLRELWGLADGGLACVFVGRIAPEKNLHLVVQAYQAIAKRHSRARMIWVGNGPALSSLRASHPTHIFAGPRIGADLAAHYASADLFLFGSLTETWGNVLTEALASGLGVVTYRRAAAEVLIEHGVNGLAIRSNDAQAFVSAAENLACDPELRHRLGANASLSMQAHGWQNIIERFESVLCETAGKPAPSDC